MNVKQYIEYVKSLDHTTTINILETDIDLSDNMEDIQVMYSEDKYSKIIDLRRK
ncbi:MAG: hypothetical protein ACXW2E_00775 [Nitrososphaeraceae archaeon]